ncbi:MAG: glycoside hydrolase family 2 protein [Lachnospiraceae bacterium]|nr:glycoside hydrolase family 2 protein [Lachnospiraceae bacterium]
MDRISIDKDWTVRIIGENVYGVTETLPVSIPGSVYSALLDAGRMPDPYYRDNELTALKLMGNDFEFSSSFELTWEQLASDCCSLRFEGIDTIADIYLNDVLIGNAFNMHRIWEFDIHTTGRVGTNTIRVIIHSPVKYIREENEKCFTGGSGECMTGFPHIRKAHCMFGWDWGPRLPDAGIWRPVYLMVGDKARIDHVHITQRHEVKKLRRISSVGYDGDTIEQSCTDRADVTLTFDIFQGIYDPSTVTRVSITVSEPGGRSWTIDNADLQGYDVRIGDAKLWWPNGYGDQPLYDISVRIFDETGAGLDEWHVRYGLRTVTMNTEPDRWGNMFAHEVNGLKIFAMGADYIPEDNILSRVTPERTRKLLEDAADAHHNVIRVWGGGYYPDDFFYDACDELGLIVWQDFMYACASYELDDDFERNVTIETVENVRRLRHHASLGVWCGNNEMETQVLDGVWQTTPKQKSDYIKLFEYIIPNIVKKEDPQTFYWPSSPSAGGNYDDPWNENIGDAHYWDVWHGEKPFTDYRRYYFRYLSEFGFQSFPCIQTIKSFAEPGDMNVFSRVMEMHQRNRAANGKIIKYLSATYLYPSSFEMLLYASQLLQLDAIRYGVEHFRRHRGRCMGTVVWQLNDIWPVASWASIDYYGRWKALHYGERRMFAPVLISAEENGEINLRPDCIAEPHPIDKNFRLNISNESTEAVSGVVRWRLCDPYGRELRSGSFIADVPALSSVWFDKTDVSDMDELSTYLWFEFVSEGQTVSEGSCIFTAPKHYHFADPELVTETEDDVITVTSGAYAQKIMLDNSAGDLKLSDNFFDMEPGSRSVRILSGSVRGLHAVSVFDIR